MVGVENLMRARLARLDLWRSIQPVENSNRDITPIGSSHHVLHHDAQWTWPCLLLHEVHRDMS